MRAGEASHWVWVLAFETTAFGFSFALRHDPENDVNQLMP